MIEKATNSEHKLGVFVKTLLRASRKDDKQSAKDSKNLQSYIVSYLSDDKTGMDWTMETIRNAVYNLAEYNPKEIDKKTNENLQSKSFETRVTRAIKDALLQVKKVNPLNKDDTDNGYNLDNDGDLTLPENVAIPTETVEIDGVKQKRPNKTTDRIKIASRLREQHFAKAFIGVSKRQPNEKTSDNIKNANELTKWLTGLSNEKIFDMDKDDEDILKALENSLDVFFTKRTSLKTTTEGNVIDTTIKEAVNQ